MSTIFAISTPPGIGGIAVIRLSGPDAIAATSAIFRPHSTTHTLDTRATHTLTFGHIIDPSTDEVLDEVVVALYRAPHSFTGEDVVEISCHGSQYIQQRLLELLAHLSHPESHHSHPEVITLLPQREGPGEGLEGPVGTVRLAAPGEFTRRAFQNGRLDLSQAEAVADLIASQNAATHRLAMSQMRGSFSNRLDALSDQLLHLATLLELELDFSEEDVEFADRTELTRLTREIDAEVTRLADTFQTGQAIKNGIPVAIIGAPNVGKSTLLNALLRDDRAIVSDIQGTTRDLIEDTFQLQGHLFRFIDTAGIRQTSDTIEQLGIDRSLRASGRAQVILLLTEPGVPYPTLDVRPDQQVIRVLNKVDKASAATDSPTTPVTATDAPQLRISAKTGEGLADLEQRLVDAVRLPEVSAGDVVLTNLRHYQAMQEAHTHLTRVLDGLSLHLTPDLIAEDLRAAISALNSILGREVTSQSTLENIFRNFCIGK